MGQIRIDDVFFFYMTAAIDKYCGALDIGINE